MPDRVPLVALVILDGWGCAPPGPGNAVEPGRDAGVRPAVAGVPAHDHRGVRRGRRPPARADGKQRGGTFDDRVGAPPVPGPDARQQVDRRPLVLREPRLAGGVRPGRARAPARPRFPRRCPLAHRARPGAASIRAREDVAARLHRWSRCLPACRARGSRRAAAGPDRHRRRAVLRDGPGQALGAHASWPTRPSRRVWARRPRTSARRSRRATTPGSPTSSSRRSCCTAAPRLEAGDTATSSTSGLDLGRRADAQLRDAGFDVTTMMCDSSHPADA